MTAPPPTIGGMLEIDGDDRRSPARPRHRLLRVSEQRLQSVARRTHLADPAAVTRASALLAVLLAACGPTEPAGTGTTAEDPTGTSTGSTGSTGDAGTAAPTTGSTTGGTTGSEPTTGLEATGLATTGAASSTTGDEPPFCAWDLPENDSFCPLLAMPNIAITGMTPVGPITFQYAYFGLHLCASCPEPNFPAVGLFAQEQSPGLDPFVGDHLILEGVTSDNVWIWHGQIAGVSLDDLPSLVVSMVEHATEEQTTPPLDPAAPPQMSGMVAISGDGWDLEGSFTATLCTTLDWTVPCE